MGECAKSRRFCGSAQWRNMFPREWYVGISGMNETVDLKYLSLALNERGTHRVRGTDRERQRLREKEETR